MMLALIRARDALCDGTCHAIFVLPLFLFWPLRLWGEFSAVNSTPN